MVSLLRQSVGTRKAYTHINAVSKQVILAEKLLISFIRKYA